MTAASVAGPIATGPRATGLPIKAFSHAILWFAVFLGGFVFYEPAPYDLLLVLLIPAWMFLGLTVPRAASPLIVLLLLFLVGGVIAATQAVHFDTQPIYYAITIFLVLSACFFACLIAQDRTRLDIIVNAWIAAALCSTALGIAGYAGLTGDLFTKFGRVTGGFQDPNVYGPFVILPYTVLVRRMLTRRFVPALTSGLMALFLLIGIFLCFSRATWALSVVSVLMMGALLFVTTHNAAARMRFVVLMALGAFVAALLIVAVLSIPAVHDLFSVRAHIEQNYDVGHLGRFQRHALGFNLMLDHPLGIGASEFGRIFGEDEHDIWLKTLTSYGWLGFLSYVTLVVWTLAAAFPLVFRASTLQPVVQIAYVVFLGHVLMATVIDIDHWRHVYLLFGVLWGAIAVDRSDRQTRLAGHLRRSGLRQSPRSATRALTAETASL